MSRFEMPCIRTRWTGSRYVILEIVWLLYDEGQDAGIQSQFARRH